MNHTNPHPVAVIGAGPVGLAAAAHLLARGLQPLVFEAGDAVGASIREWGHVRIFSPWEYDLDPVAVELLERHGWTAPDGDGYPTGTDIVERYLEPLAATPEIAAVLRLNARVLGVTRAGIDKLKDAGRDEAPFELVVDEAGVETRYVAASVIDASGTWTRPNPLGAGGLPAAGERAHADRIVYGIPDVLDRDRARYAGKRVLVVGSGHSAFNAILDLVALRDSEPATQIVWAIRGQAPGRKYGGGGDDQLPARGALGSAVRELVADGSVALAAGFQTRAVSTAGERLVLADGDAGDRGRRGDRGHRVPARSDAARRAAARPRRPRRGRPSARAADRPQPALVRERAAARRRRALAPRRRRLHGRHEELRPRADLPAADRLRAGPLGGRGAGR